MAINLPNDFVKQRQKMGNSNSGRYGGKAKCEQFLSIDVRIITRKNALKAGNQLTWTWSNGSNMGISVHNDWIDLQYSINSGKSNKCPIYLGYTDCNYGGQRTWLICPTCSRRLAKLFLRKGRFSCRHCHKLVYRTQVLDTIGRHQRAYYKIQNKLDEHEMKPKGMHWKTFERLHNKKEFIDSKINQAFNLAAKMLFKRIGIQ